MLIPIRTDSPIRRTPVVNHVVIAVNMLIFFVFDIIGPRMGWNVGGNVQDPGMLWPDNPEAYQFITYQFLHGDIWHLAGNMLFLWVFGNAVNSKMGNTAYLLFYLASGIFAGMGFATGDSHAPCLGASGSIASVTMAFLVLFPRSRVTVVYWFFFIGVWHVQALIFISLKIILWDNLIAPGLSSGEGHVSVAYSAHLAGYFFGIVVCLFLLWIRALPRDQYDILALIKRRRQRQQFRSAMANPNARAKAAYGRVAQPVSVVTGRPVEAQAPEVYDEITRMRMEIGELLVRRAYSEAAELYQEMTARDPGQVLPCRQMLDVANQLMTLQKYPQAAAAYEKYLNTYPTDSEVVQVKLLLGITYAKYLQQDESAAKYLQECLPRLTQPDQIRQVKHWLEQVGGTQDTSSGEGPWTA